MKGRETMSIESTRRIVQRYLNSEHSDVSMMAKDVTFTIMATGQEHQGPEAVLGMLTYFYHIAFDAKATTRVVLFGENNAMVEGDFVGKHIGEFAGILATGKDVRVPLCVVYDLENDQIKHGRVYFEMPALMQQLGIPMG
jgi:predicted ester cyclase